MTVIVIWTDGTMHQRRTELEDWRICEMVCYNDGYSGFEIIRRTVDAVEKDGIMSIDEFWYED